MFPTLQNVDDKIIKKALEEGVTADEIADTLYCGVQKDMEDLNIKPATANPLATQEIGGMIEMIRELDCKRACL